MAEWFHAKVKFLRQMDNGLVKQVTEQYLVDSYSFTECEARVLQEQGEGVREVTCQAIARSPIKEVVMYGDTDLWFKCKVQYSLVDEETEKEKKVTTYLLVNANDVKEAYERTEEHLKEMLVPFTIPKIEESPIIEVYEYQKQAPKGFVKVTKDEGTPREERQPVGFVNKGAKSAIDASARGEGIVDMGFAYSKQDQVGKKRKHQRSHDDGHGHPIIELPLVKPTDPTWGQAVEFHANDEIHTWYHLHGDRDEVKKKHQSLSPSDFIKWIVENTPLNSDQAAYLALWMTETDPDDYREEPAETRNRFYNSNRPPSFDD